MRRLFVAVDVPREVKEMASQVQLLLPEHARLVVPKQVHITLKFLGWATDPSPIIDSLRSVEHRQCTVRLNGLGGFPKLSRPRVLFIGGESRCLRELSEKIDFATSDFEMDKPFALHATIARFKNSKMMEIDWPSMDLEFTATQFVLYESKMTGNGPIYTVVERFKLQ